MITHKMKMGMKKALKVVLSTTMMSGLFYVPGSPIQSDNIADAATIGENWGFSYTGIVQTFTAPETGIYNLELWGARGGGSADGEGGYAKGDIDLIKGQILKVYVGEKPSTVKGGWNGGGDSDTHGVTGGGGGATDVRIGGETLNDRVIVAGGGGGLNATSNEGFGGGLRGFDANPPEHNKIYEVHYGKGGTQTAGGVKSPTYSTSSGTQTAGSFGQGGKGGKGVHNGGGGGGGGGYYGGSGASGPSSGSMGGGGGSSYIGGVANGQTIAGNAVMPNPSGGTMIGNANHGQAKVTFKEKIEAIPGAVWNYDYTGGFQIFTVPSKGRYKIEVWGAQGGTANSGKGGYANGELVLNKGEALNLYVGSMGGVAGSWNGTYRLKGIGGWNGGGNGADIYHETGHRGSGGGGATDIRKGGLQLESRILVAGGGGGSGVTSGGAGGAMIGKAGLPGSGQTGYAESGTGGSQTYGGFGGIQGGNGTRGSNGALGNGGSPSNSENNLNAGSGGGGGYYGGGSGGSGSMGYGGGNGGGGSSYIGGTSNGLTIAGDATMPNPNGGTMVGKTGNGYVRITMISVPEWDFDYSGNVQTFTAPEAGTYQLETWGAQGGVLVEGQGGYAKGKIELSKGQVLKVYVGEKPKTRIGGWNGGGNGGSSSNGGGGGATDIRIGGETLNDRIIVGGGGGGSNATYNNGFGGGLNGIDSYGYDVVEHNYHSYVGKGGTQTEGGAKPSTYSTSSGTQTAGTFGQGGNGGIAISTGGGGGGGGGYYGGSGASGPTNGHWGGGGGSGYIGGVSNGLTIAGNVKMPNPHGGTMEGNKGHGYARITMVTTPEWEYDYTGDAQTFSAPNAGRYKIEIWGAQGNSRDYSYRGGEGRGGFSSGEIDLQKGEKLHINVGGKQKTFNNVIDVIGVHYNGEGIGGGATDIRLVGGTWHKFDSLKSRIMVAGGGGHRGGLNNWNSGSPYAGEGGGLTGGKGGDSSAPTNIGGIGGGQTLGAAFGIGGQTISYGTGGSGYYGGLPGEWTNGVAGGGGGSSFISGHPGADAIKESSTSELIVHTGQPNHYSGKVFSNTEMLQGVRVGNGYARITMLLPIITSQSPVDGIQIQDNYLDVSWNGEAPSGLFIEHYEIKAGTILGGSDILPITNKGKSKNHQITIPSWIPDNTTIYWSVRAIDNFGNVGPWSDKTVIYSTPDIGDFEIGLVDSLGLPVTGWINKDPILKITYNGDEVVDGIQKEYQIKGYHNEWRKFQTDTLISVEGEYDVYGQIIHKSGIVSEQKSVKVKFDKTPVEFNYVSLKEKEDGTHEISVWAVDTLSGIDRLEIVDGGTTKKLKQSPMSSIYKLDGLTQVPVSVKAYDQAGNESIVSFTNKPTIEFTSPYTLDAVTFRESVEVKIANGINLSYKLGNQLFECNSDPCQTKIDRNTLLTAINTDGIKQTSKEIRIKNIDKSKLNLLLHGGRDAVNENKINLTWNYKLTNGTLHCYEGGVEKNSNITGTGVEVSVINTIYDCYITGTYAGENLTSNRIVIYPDQTKPIIGVEVEKTEVNQNIYIEESRIGNSYFINTKRSNSKDNYVPIPEGPFK